MQFSIEHVNVYLVLASYGENYDLYRRALTISLLLSPNCLQPHTGIRPGAPPEMPGQEGIPR
jgi:hypothetical protein